MPDFIGTIQPWEAIWGVLIFGSMAFFLLRLAKRLFWP